MYLPKIGKICFCFQISQEVSTALEEARSGSQRGSAGAQLLVRISAGAAVLLQCAELPPVPQRTLCGAMQACP